MAEQQRGELRHYIAATKDGPFMRLGEGFSSLSAASNPQKKDVTYINDKSSTTVTGYKHSFSVDGNIFTGDPANKLLYDLGWKQAKGDSANVYMVEVQNWEDGTTTGSKNAFMQLYAYSADNDGGGAGGEDVTFSGTLDAKGDRTFGDAVITVDPDTSLETCTFTAAADTTAP